MPDDLCAQGPRCSIRSKNMYSDLEVDYVKLLLLNLPGVLLVRCCSPCIVRGVCAVRQPHLLACQ